MEKSVLTSVRLAAPIRRQLDQVSHQLHRRPNWIISEALKEYLNHHNTELQAQVRQESLLVAQAEKNHDEAAIWEQNIDVTGWE